MLYLSSFVVFLAPFDLLIECLSGHTRTRAVPRNNSLATVHRKTFNYSIKTLDTFCSVSHIITRPLHTKGGLGKREAHENWSAVMPEKAAIVTGITLRTTGPVPADSRTPSARNLVTW